MKRILLLCTVITAVFLTGCGKGNTPRPQIEDMICVRDNRYTCTFEGVKHNLIIDLPESSENAPLVLMLHGYGNTAESFRTSVHFEEKANPLGYAVVYAEGSTVPGDRTSSTGWNSEELPDGSRDTEFLAALAGYLQDEYSLDRNSTFAVGFSNGAFMTHTLAMRKSDTFSACVSVAGIMQKNVWDSINSTASVGFFQITGEKDKAVPKHSDGTADHSKAPAIEDVMDYWADANGSALSDSITIGKGSVLSEYENKDTRRQVWHLIVKDGSHSWPAAQYNGFDAGDIILEFLETQR